MNPGTEDETVSVLRVPGWERFPWLRAGFSTRSGGESVVYGDRERNLGWTAEDEPAIVARNRAAFVREVGRVGELSLVTVGQVHGTRVRDLQKEPGPWMTEEGRAMMEGDGLISLTPGRLLAILTADCVPVLVADTRLRAVGAFHAGWRGTLGQIVVQGVSEMSERYGSRKEDLVAAVGPCIRACCFAVGPEVRAAFTEQFADAATLFRGGEGGGALTMDLQEANVRQLVSAGVAREAIEVLGLCTACAREADGRRRFFSYRAEGGKTGRMLSAIGAVAEAAAVKNG